MFYHSPYKYQLASEYHDSYMIKSEYHQHR